MRPFSHAVIFLFLLLPSLLLPAQALAAGLILDAGARVGYDDNVTGTSSEEVMGGETGTTPMMGPMMGSSGMHGGPGGGGQMGQMPGGGMMDSDVFASVYASIGGYTGTAATFFAKADFEGYNYFRVDALDSVSAGVSAGAIKSIGSVFTAGASGKWKYRQFDESGRSGQSYGGTLELREDLKPSFWLKEFYDYERNDADSGGLSFDAHSAGIRAGFYPTAKNLFRLGYSYTLRAYEGPDVKTHSVGCAFTRELAEKIYMTLEYSRLFNYDGADYTNNLVSAGVGYSY